MPVFVPAVRRSRRKGARSTAGASEGSQEACDCPLTQQGRAGVEEDPRSSEESLIRKNLRSYFTDFDSERERSILKHSPPACWRAFESPAEMDAEPSRHSPNPMLIPNGVEKSFKSRRPFVNRQKDVEDILRKHPHKIPIIVERSKNEKYLDILDKSKFLVPEELTMSQLTTIIRRRLQLADTQAFYLMVNRRSMASASTSLSDVYSRDKDSDGFLYITYASQEMFG